MDIGSFKFNESGLIPVIVQDFNTGKVLMLAYADKKAVELTIKTGRSHFWSRSRQRIWMKGEESGNTQNIRSVRYDCDLDTLLYQVDQKGVACHTGNESCFFRTISGFEGDSSATLNESADQTIDKVFKVVEDRKKNPKQDSYVSTLLTTDIERVLKKIGEESSETIIAALKGDPKETVYEITDLWFHTLVLLSKLNLRPDDIRSELERRYGKKKVDYSS